MTIKVGDIYEDCAYHPVKCTHSDGDDVEGISLLDGSEPRSCSIKHCGVKKLTQKQADDLLELWKKGERCVLIANGYSEEEADMFINNWRTR